MTDKRLQLLAVIFAGLACFAAYLALPQMQRWLSPKPTPNQSTITPVLEFSTSVMLSTSTPHPTQLLQPTYTPYPTYTVPPPKPTSTPTTAISQDTPSDTMLDVGQTWRSGNILLTLVDVYFSLRSTCTMGLAFQLENDSSSPVIFTLRNNEFNLEDNLGNHWKTTGVYHVNRCPVTSDSFDFVLQSGENLDKWVGFLGNATDPAVEYVIVTVTGILNFDGAKWKVPISN